MTKKKLIQQISVGGLFTAITVILQSAPIYLPTFGLLLSPFSTLPVALAAVMNIYLGIAVLLSSSLILIAVSINEAIILLFTTGLLGLILGGLIYRKGMITSILASVVSLVIGMMILTYLVGIPGFVSFTSSLSIATIIIIYFIFSILYICIWALCLIRFADRLIKVCN